MDATANTIINTNTNTRCSTILFLYICIGKLIIIAEEIRLHVFIVKNVIN